MNAHTADWQFLSERIAKLEKQNRRFKAAGLAGCILAAAAVLMGQAAPKSASQAAPQAANQTPHPTAPQAAPQTAPKAEPKRGPRIVEADEFILKDAHGHVRARFQVNDGVPEIRLLDGKGQDSLLIQGEGAGPGYSGPAVRFFQRTTGKERITIGGEDYSGLTISDPSGAERIRLGQAAASAPELSMKDAGGVVRALWRPDSLALRDAKGQSAAVLSSAQPGQPSLTLQDSKGTTRAALSFDHDAPGLFIYDANSKKRITLESLDSPMLLMSDDAGKPSASLAAGGVLAPLLTFYDSNEKQRALLGIDADDGFPKLILQDADEKVLAKLSETPQGPAFGLLDPAGNVRAALAATGDGTQLSISDRAGWRTSIGTTGLATRSGKTENTTAASIVLFDKDQKVIWKTP